MTDELRINVRNAAGMAEGTELSRSPPAPGSPVAESVIMRAMHQGPLDPYSRIVVYGATPEADDIVDRGAIFEHIPTSDSRRPPKVIAVVIPIYNEGPWILTRTLSHLAVQQRCLQKAFPEENYHLHVCVIFDGALQADENTLKELYDLGLPICYAEAALAMEEDEDANLIVQNIVQAREPMARSMILPMHRIDEEGGGAEEAKDDEDDAAPPAPAGLEGAPPPAPMAGAHSGALPEWVPPLVHRASSASQGPASPGAADADAENGAAGWQGNGYDSPGHQTPRSAKPGSTLHPVPVSVLPALRAPQYDALSEKATASKEHGIHPLSRKNTKGLLEPMHIACMVKRTNRRKHNSHEWFFRKFCEDVKPTFAFATDAGTTYGPWMLTLLVDHLHRHPNCVAAAGHQRVMYADEQRPPLNENTDFEPFLPSMFRLVQSFDFESGQAIFKGANAMMHFLSVIPGPCGLYRFSMIQGRPLENYFRAVSQPAHEQSIATGNLQIAEDRILTYEAVLGHDRDEPVEQGVAGSFHTDWVPAAKFFFESEYPLSELVKQRRRWMNGTICGNFWLLGQFLSCRRSFRCADCCRFFSVMGLLLNQILVFLIMSIMWGFFIVTLKLSLSSLGILAAAWDRIPVGEEAQFIPVYAVDILLAYYAVVNVVHVYASSRDDAYNHWTWLVLVITNGLLMTLLLFTVIMTLITSLVHSGKLDIAIHEEGVKISLGTLRWLAGASIIYMFVPFLPAILIDWEAPRLMLAGLVPYLFALPTMTAGFMSYSLARINDLSWGTKTNKKPTPKRRKKRKADDDEEDDDLPLDQQLFEDQQDQMRENQRGKERSVLRRKWEGAGGQIHRFAIEQTNERRAGQWQSMRRNREGRIALAAVTEEFEEKEAITEIYRLRASRRRFGTWRGTIGLVHILASLGLGFGLGRVLGHNQEIVYWFAGIFAVVAVIPAALSSIFLIRYRWCRARLVTTNGGYDIGESDGVISCSPPCWPRAVRGRRSSSATAATANSRTGLLAGNRHDQQRYG